MVDQVPIQQQTPPSEKISFQEFLRRYDGQHAEWIMGEVELIVSNNRIHQMILRFLSSLIDYYLGVTQLGELMLAGFPMYLGEDRPAREPDLIIVLNAHLDRIKNTFLDGAGDLVVEIISPESDVRDRGKKLAEYEAAQIKEYWVIDPLRTETHIYVLGEDQRYHEQPLDSQGRLNSKVLPKFALDPAIFWQEPLPRGEGINELLRQMGVIN